ncbi:uncharacterized protein LOC132546917 [Ylistrum balloti]|uniref:uncharacterized protein LOC132546917 n=1 Tax=Ylistrum balloti TaxID=509963 RepID=UPI002905C3B4|nr:uncharacterized protein LOC132546917 [Ylistrum balloti]
MKKQQRNRKRKQKEFRHLVERFRQMQHHEEVAQEKEFKRRRDSRERRKVAVKTDRRLVKYKRIYVLSSLALVSGSIMTFGSVVKGLGEGSVLWTHRSVFIICGPVTLGLGVLLLFLATGLVVERQEKLKKRILDMGDSFNSHSFNDRKSSCHTNSSSKLLLSREVSSSGSSATDTSGSSCNRAKSSDYRSKIGRQASEESEMEIFLDSSNSSVGSSGLSFSAKWEALSNFPKQGNTNNLKQNEGFIKKDNIPACVPRRGIVPKNTVSTLETCIIVNEIDQPKDRGVTCVSSPIGKQTSI